MIGSKQKYKWRVIGQSVRGASHIRTGKPNQDALCYEPRRSKIENEEVILAISDGHGSDRYFRSDRGSRFAVKVACEAGQEFLRGGRGYISNLRFIRSEADERLPRDIVRRWLDKVEEDYQEEPFTEEELRPLAAQARERVRAKPTLAYGATLLVVLVATDFILYLQLGDGDIMTVSDEGRASRIPLSTDERLIANETTSLCVKKAWLEFRSYFQVLSDGPPPALILASTDGYSNSFSDEEGFLQVGSDIMSEIQKTGLDEVEKQLEGWLTETSQRGSGDDITLGLICRVDRLPTPNYVPLPKSERRPGFYPITIFRAHSREIRKWRR